MLKLEWIVVPVCSPDYINRVNSSIQHLYQIGRIRETGQIYIYIYKRTKMRKLHELPHTVIVNPGLYSIRLTCCGTASLRGRDNSVVKHENLVEIEE